SLALLVSGLAHVDHRRAVVRRLLRLTHGSTLEHGRRQRSRQEPSHDGRRPRAEAITRARSVQSMSRRGSLSAVTARRLATKERDPSGPFPRATTGPDDWAGVGIRLNSQRPCAAW